MENSRDPECMRVAPCLLALAPPGESYLCQPAYSLDDGIRELIKGFAMIRNSRYSNV